MGEPCTWDPRPVPWDVACGEASPSHVNGLEGAGRGRRRLPGAQQLSVAPRSLLTSRAPSAFLLPGGEGPSAPRVGLPSALARNCKGANHGGCAGPAALLGRDPGAHSLQKGTSWASPRGGQSPCQPKQRGSSQKPPLRNGSRVSEPCAERASPDTSRPPRAPPRATLPHPPGSQTRVPPRAVRTPAAHRARHGGVSRPMTALPSDSGASAGFPRVLGPGCGEGSGGDPGGSHARLAPEGSRTLSGPGGPPPSRPGWTRRQPPSGSPSAWGAGEGVWTGRAGWVLSLQPHCAPPPPTP